MRRARSASRVCWVAGGRARRHQVTRTHGEQVDGKKLPSYNASMTDVHTAEDLLPLVAHLTHDEKVRLVQLVLQAAAQDGDYAAKPPKPDEFNADTDPLAWDAGGWEEFRAPG